MGDIIKGKFHKDREPRTIISAIVGELGDAIHEHSRKNVKGNQLILELVGELQTDFAKEAVSDLVEQVQGGAPQGRHNIDSDVLKNLPDRISRAFDSASGVNEMVAAKDKKLLNNIMEAVDEYLCY